MNTRELIIEAGRTEGQYWKDLWRYQELFYFLSWRSTLVRYKQSAVGIAWTLIRPFLTMVVFTVVFSNLAKLPSGGAPYPILVFAALLLWHRIARELSQCSNSAIANANLISSVYFPRLIVPTSAVIVSFGDFLLPGMILLALRAWYNFLPDWLILTLPLFILIAFVTSMGAGVLSAQSRQPAPQIAFMNYSGLVYQMSGNKSFQIDQIDALLLIEHLISYEKQTITSYMNDA